ncbi:hypothetical protein [Magnetospirillum sp. 15-1]|uniref:hypothetical protein n=1 Tax=Magnetospirillum sp. 15-1 TaxID=1979370 RepID=UPI00114481B7|nr:hypothetical protein [Magnetospirillum sp. 15-1]
MRLIAIVMAASLGLAACGTSPVKLDATTPTPPNRILAFGNPGSGLSTVIVVRDSGFVGSGVYQALKVDGIWAAKLDTSESVTLYMAPGDHVFGVIPTPNLFGTHSIYETSLRIEPMRTHYLRISIGAEGTTRIAPTAEVQ